MGTRTRKMSLRGKILINLVILFAILTAAYVAISYFEFKEYTVSDCVDYAKGLCSLIEDELDAEHIDDYIEQGFNYPGYAEIRTRLEKLRAAYPDIVFLYVYQIREDGCHVVFDLDTEDITASAPGEIVEFDESYKKYIPDMLAGKDVPAVISRDQFGYLLTIYTPMTDAAGNCRCYVGVDYSMDLLTEYVENIVKRIVLVFVGVMVLLSAVTIIAANHGIVKPVKQLENRAFRDTLTGLLNRNAYYDYNKKLDAQITAGDAQFSIIMVDVNNLKKMNDNYGHERGNIYLKNAADLIASVFGTENLYRIGGDEFVVVMEGKQRQAESTHLLREFRARIRDFQEMKGLKPWEQVYAAAGIADYTQGKDTSTVDVLKRADMAMYTEKVEMKAARTE